MAVIGAVAANLGEVDVAVFNTSYRIMWIVLVMVNALSGAAAIKMSMRLGSLNHRGAKQVGHVGVFLSLSILMILFFAIVTHIRAFGRIFTNDPDFLDLFESVRWPFTITLVLMNAAIAIEKIPYSMGRTTEVFWYGLIASWGGQVPGVLVLTRYWRNDLIGLYWGMAIGYLMLFILYVPENKTNSATGHTGSTGLTGRHHAFGKRKRSSNPSSFKTSNRVFHFD